MLSVKIRRVFLARHRVDFRKRFDGLLAEAFQLGADPYEGDCVLFVKRDHTQLRAIVGDGVGLYLICRRFEGGCLRNLAVFARSSTAMLPCRPTAPNRARTSWSSHQSHHSR